MSTFHCIGGIIFMVIPGCLLLIVAYWIALEHRSDRIPILLYHRLLSKCRAELGEVSDSEMIYVTYDISFAQQMQYLVEEGFTTLDLDDYYEIRSGRQPLPRRPVIITFDDGYLSNYTIGFPILKKLRLKATVFVVPDPNPYTRARVAGIDGFVTPAQMLEMAKCGVSIQSHTLTHPVLTELDDAAVERELVVSRQVIAKWTGVPVAHIAIPRAGYDRRVRALVERAGYRTACCNNKGSATGRSDNLALPRIVVERDMSLRQFSNALTPRGSAMVRIVGEFKRLPLRIGGVRLARRVRPMLYDSRFGPLFQLHRLRHAVMVVAGLYVSMALYYWIRVAFLP